MSGRLRALIAIELLLAVAAVVGAVLSWNAGVHTTIFAPEKAGAPPYAATEYSGSWLTLSFVLVLAAGLAVVDVIRRTRPGVPEGGMIAE